VIGPRVNGNFRDVALGYVRRLMLLGQKFALSRVSLYRVESVVQENTYDLAFHCRRTIPSVSSVYDRNHQWFRY